MNKTTCFTHLFKKFVPSGGLIFESGLSICNYQRCQKNFFIVQKKENFQPLRKNRWKKVDWFLAKNVFSQRAKWRVHSMILLQKNGYHRPFIQTRSFHSKRQTSFLKTLWFQRFEKSNQNTFFLQRPLSFPLEWVQRGDLLSDCSASHWGELALGHNLFVAYMPWEGFNFEDAVLINEKILSKYTSLHIQKYECEILEDSLEQITSQIPGLPDKDVQKLDRNGIIKIGSWVQEKDILIGKILLSDPDQEQKLPLLMHEKLLYDLIGHETRPIQEKCLRVPLGSFGRIIRIIYTHNNHPNQAKPNKQESQPIKNMGRFSGRRFTQRYRSMEVPFFLKSFSRNISQKWIHHRTIFSRWLWFLNVCIQKLKISQLLVSYIIKKASNSIFSLRPNLSPTLSLKYVQKITIYMAEQRAFQIGDKISGRHGNKGIISKICSNEDMPYCPNGCPLDILLNPLGVPSRMNVGQIFECLLGWTGQIFQTKFQVVCFDEIIGYEASRSFIYSKLLESCTQTRYPWLFSKKNPGKVHLFDGRTGQIFQQSVSIGSSYLMKLIHIVDEKIHARATGPYSLITQQPLKGRAQHGGQRIGEMEVWAFQGYGTAYALQELLTVKSDDLQGRNQLMYTLLKNTSFHFGTPESFRVVLRELQCLCLDLQLHY
uniref:DNA-directed RNA polymerase n=1 Tax=Boodleopsis pusilla TaxID=381415 RepID=A0A386AZD1_9CHLO|nr:RNA polymerase b-subunit [Boodleopsis pusilla]AYC64804.1 RNA polymerase b-subunit [Boodleopsis pusilla]